MYVCTYKNNHALNNWFLKSLSESNYPKDLVEVFIIDNAARDILHTCKIDEMYKGSCTLLNNIIPHFSTGHLARTWNYSIINGFEDLDKPQCDAVIAVQNDTILTPNWYESVVETLKTYDFVQQGHGDQFLIFTPNAIKNIGLFDERFCGIGYQEADYFLRAVKFYPEKSSINDYAHGRFHNVTQPSPFLIEDTESGSSRQEPSHLISMSISHPFSRNFFKHKWGEKNLYFLIDAIKNFNLEDFGWQAAVKEAQQLCANHFTYPYFENKLNPDTLRNQLYVTPRNVYPVHS